MNQAPEQFTADEYRLGQVSAIRSYGAFVHLEDGQVGLVHISEVAEEFVRDISVYLSVDQTVVVKVIGRNEEGKLNLSLKRVSQEERVRVSYHQEIKRVQHALQVRQPAAWLRQQQRLIRSRLSPERPVPPSKASLSAWTQEAHQALVGLHKRARSRERLYRRLYF